MPALFRCLSLSLILLLAACAATPPPPPSSRTAAASTKTTPPARSPAGPARTLAVNAAPAQASRPSDQAILGGEPTPPQAPQGSGPIVMGAPLPTPKPLAAPQASFNPTPTPFGPAPAPAEATAAQPHDPLDPPLFPAPGAPSAVQAAPGSALATVAPAPANAPVPMADTPGLGMPASGPPRGVAGIAWGSPAKSVTGLVVHEVDAPVSVVTYTWPAGPREIMGAPVRDAYFEFYQDRFYHAWIDLDGLAAYKTALAGLTAAYGPPSSENLEKFYHAWNLGEVNVYCAFHPAENEGDVSYFYQPLYDRLAAVRKASQAKAGPRRSKS